MRLLTKEIELNLPKLYETEGIPVLEKTVHAKYFNLSGAGTWYAVEGQRKDDDFIFFGYVELFEGEWGYFSLKELEGASGSLGVKIERELHFSPIKLRELLRE